MESSRNQNKRHIVPAALLAAGVLIGAVGGNALADDSKPTPATWTQVDTQLEHLAASNKAEISELEATLNNVSSIYLDKVGQETNSIRAKFNDAKDIKSDSDEIFSFNTEIASDGSRIETISSVSGDSSTYSLSVTRNADGGVTKVVANRNGVSLVKTPLPVPGQVETQTPTQQPYATSLSINLDGEMSYINIENQETEALFVDGHLSEAVDRPAQSQFDAIAYGIESLEQFLSRAQTASPEV